MNHGRALFVFLLLGILSASSTPALDLTFEDRVRAQEAIERVRHSHLAGSRRSFEQAMPREAIETKVRAYLEQSEALETIWHTPVTATMLDSEMARIAKDSRMPERLRELYAALGDDPFLIAECLARPALVARLTQSFSGNDWDSVRSEVEKTFDPSRVVPAAGAVDLHVPDTAASCVPDDTWDNGSLDDVPDPTNDPKAIWTGAEMVVWGGLHLSRGGRYDPATDTWSLTSVIDAPAARVEFTAIWTGDRMIVWGGRDAHYDALDTGGLYDPLADTWTPTSVGWVPGRRQGHSAVWTGTEMLVFGGYDGTDLIATGGRYNPSTNTWAPDQITSMPVARGYFAAVWTGTAIVIWGGYVPGNGWEPTNTGARYDPVTNVWTPISTTGTLFPRAYPTAVWTGNQVLVWGGSEDDPARASDLGRYDPATDTWTTVSSFLAPAWRHGHTAVWTGTEMIVWGGYANGDEANTGGRFDPATNTWTDTSTVGAPSGRTEHAAVWTGTQMIVWGGYEGGNAGGRYDPATDTWTPTRTAYLALSERVSLWTGNEMILWGGEYPDAPGARYDPVLDTWTPVTTVNEPARRSYHTAVWTGDEMIVWGGSRSGQELGTGARYDPSSDTWTATSSFNAPDRRFSHTAVWTGSRMIIWGGGGVGGSNLNTGGSYDPVTNTWTVTSTVGAPAGRRNPSSVWTGSKMIVWGGLDHGGVRTGGVYDLATDTWTATSLTGAPSKRWEHTAVWTGSRMIVWGGLEGNLVFPVAGGSYDPVANTWTATSISNAPSGRYGHTSVWTGTRMIVFGGLGDSDGEPLPGGGGLYDPSTDTWSPTSLTNAPSPRYDQAAQWTGDFMIVWGGTGGPGTGGRYAFGQAVDLDGDGYSACGGDCDDSVASIHPGAAEACDALDNDCDFAIDEGVPLPTTRPSVSVGKAGTATALSWAPAPDATGYDAVKGNLGPLRNSGGNFTTTTKACIANDVATTTASDGEVPPPTGGLWFLVRSVNACSGAGTYDEPGSSQQGSRDAEIAGSASACP